MLPAIFIGGKHFTAEGFFKAKYSGKLQKILDDAEKWDGRIPEIE